MRKLCDMAYLCVRNAVQSSWESWRKNAKNSVLAIEVEEFIWICTFHVILKMAYMSARSSGQWWSSIRIKWHLDRKGLNKQVAVYQNFHCECLFYCCHHQEGKLSIRISTALNSYKSSQYFKMTMNWEFVSGTGKTRPES